MRHTLITALSCLAVRTPALSGKEAAPSYAEETLTGDWAGARSAAAKQLWIFIWKDILPLSIPSIKYIVINGHTMAIGSIFTFLFLIPIIGVIIAPYFATIAATKYFGEIYQKNNVILNQ